MKRHRHLKRRKPLRGDPKKIQEWKDRSRTRIKPVSKKRAAENRDYNDDRKDFIAKHPICPVTGDPATEIHHSAKRVAEWLNLKRYWIALSSKAHAWVEANGNEAETVGLVVRINPAETFDDHIKYLRSYDIDPNDPLFYHIQPIHQFKLNQIRAKIKRSE